MTHTLTRAVASPRPGQTLHDPNLKGRAAWT